MTGAIVQFDVAGRILSPTISGSPANKAILHAAIGETFNRDPPGSVWELRVARATRSPESRG